MMSGSQRKNDHVDTSALADAVSFDAVLPVLYAIDDTAIGLAVEREVRAGKSVSCAKGCSACCRAQPVPVTPPEALALLKLVEALPAVQQTEIRQKFADAVERIDRAGLLPLLSREEPLTSKEQARQVARQYFDLKIACPFLVDDACGIYVDRPFVCRQYLVTSPAALCNDPFVNPVKPIAMPLRPAMELLLISEKWLGTPQYTVPLTLALEHAARHRDSLMRRFPTDEIMRECVNALA